MKSFPENFYWGAATASYQVEGGIENCDWAKAARDGRVPECGRACDHYNQYENDFDLAVELGHNAHRFSIEWARIEPEAGKFNQDEIEHYRQVLQALKQRVITPYMTLWHFTLPQWFVDRGGFEHKDSPKIFARYARFVIEQLGDEINRVTTMNEPMVLLDLGWRKGNWPPFKKFNLGSFFTRTHSGDNEQNRPDVSNLYIFTYFTVLKNLIKAQKLAYQAIKQVNKDIDVSLVKHTIAYDHDGRLFNRFRAWFQDRFFNHSFLKRVAPHVDSFGLNYYHYVPFGSEIERKTDMGWNFAPEHIYEALLVLWRYRKPIFVSEAGIADHDDSDRAEYIEKQIVGVKKALEEGIDVRGHLYWSLMDNYEWALGFDKKFGLIEIDYETLERKVRPSAWRYKELIKQYSKNIDE